MSTPEVTRIDSRTFREGRVRLVLSEHANLPITRRIASGVECEEWHLVGASNDGRSAEYARPS